MATKTAAPSSTDAARLPSTAAYCWHADPVHFALARDHLLLTPLQEAEGQGLDDDTVQALLADAAPSLQAAQAQLHLCDGDWFIKRDTAWQLDCTPLAAALGAPVQSLLPQGPDAAAWRKLLTEIQIGWHHLGVNERREQQGQPVVNGLWLHGGGVYRPLNFWSLTTVYSDDPVVRGWALASGVVPHNMQALQTPLQFSRANGSTTADHLIVWPHLLVPQRLSQWHDWLRELAHLEQFLEQAVTAAWRDGVQRIEVMLTGAQSVRVVAISATDRWRIWRRNDLSTVFSEPADSSNSFSA